MAGPVQPFTPEELEQVRAHKDIPLTLAGVGDIKSSIMRLELRPDLSVRERQLILDTFRLLATLAERDERIEGLGFDIEGTRASEQFFKRKFEETEAQLTASHNAALERAAALATEHANKYDLAYRKTDAWVLEQFAKNILKLKRIEGCDVT